MSMLLHGCMHDTPNTTKEENNNGVRKEVLATDTAAGEDTLSQLPEGLADVRRPDMKVRIRKGSALLLETEGFQLSAVDTAVRHAGVYSVTSLLEEDLEPLPQGMKNMTASAAGYRLLPGGEHFSPYAEVRVAYDLARLPEGYTADDIYTSYYDGATQTWVRLERLEVDTVNREIVSATTHFTDFINELLKSPEMPETQAFVPTALTDLEAVNPLDGITLIQPPTANNNGTANISYPLEIPQGRAGMQPNLALTYSSSGGDGWLGVGWDIAVPAITLDTRWGVPRYNPDKETEIYLLDGEQLITVDTAGEERPMPHRTNQQTDRLPDGTQFYARTGDAHDSIIRHGNSPKNYWWEVVDRNGVTHYYGRYRYYPTPVLPHKDPHPIIFPPDDGRLFSNSNPLRATQTTQSFQSPQEVYIPAPTVPDPIILDPYPCYDARAGLPSTLCDDNGNIARWVLTESRDPYGNTVRYYYDHATVKNHGATGRQIYLDSISYTCHNNADGQYTVMFCRTANSTTDIPMSCNNGFKEITDQVLNNVYVKYGDSILTAWLFDMENAYKTNYKNRLTSVTKVDSAYTGMRDFLSLRCHCIRRDEDEDSLSYYYELSKDSINKENNYAGSTYTFTYYDAPDPNQMFDSVKDCELVSHNLHGSFYPRRLLDISNATALGLSHSSSWNVGGTAAVGLGPNICFTNNSLGGNYSWSKSSSESLLTLVDLDGDGLADKVYVKGGKVYFCRHIQDSVGKIRFDTPKIVSGISHFMRENSESKTTGVQVALGASGSISWTEGQSITSTYFADVNGDGLTDLVENGQVYFNSLNNDGVPKFTLYKSSDYIENSHGESKVLYTSADSCGGIIFDGKVNDSITCERNWGIIKDSIHKNCDRVFAQTLARRYEDNEDTMAMIIPNRTNTTDTSDTSYTVQLCTPVSWVCNYRDKSLGTEAVRVWVAPSGGEFHLTSRVGLIKDSSPSAQAAQHADGVTYIIQHTHNVSIQDSLLSTQNNILTKFDICDTCYCLNVDDSDHMYTLDTTIEVSEGDMLFFRLRSNENHQLDNVYDHHVIIDLGNNDEYYDSEHDFVISSDYAFQAPVNGRFTINAEYRDDNNATYLQLKIDDTVIDSQYNNSTYYYEENIQRGQTLKLSVEPRDSTPFPKWGEVTCRPYFTFTPDSTDKLCDTIGSDTIYTGLPTIEGWFPVRMNITHDGIDSIPLLQHLFGPLYHGWGQFAYHPDENNLSKDLIDVEKLIFTGLYNNRNEINTENLRRRGNIDINRSRGFSSMHDFQNNNRDFYNPISNTSFWVEMTPDVEHQAWVSYGHQNYVARDTIGNTMREEWYSTSFTLTNDSVVMPPERIYYDDPVPADSPNGTPAKAVRRANRSDSRSWSIGAFGLGNSWSEGTNNVVMEYMDLNGDRYPDNVGIERVQYREMWGGLGEMRDLPTRLKSYNNSQTKSEGRSYSASPVSIERIPGGKQDKAAFTLKGTGSGSISGSGNIGEDAASGSWTDINGDGLPDFITRNGKVYLNIGYGFLKDGDWHHHDIQCGVSGSASVSAKNDLGEKMSNSYTDVWQGSIQGGASFDGSYNKTEKTMIDMNGDGLPDLVTRPLPRNIVNLFGNTDNIDNAVTTVSFNLGNGRWSDPQPVNIGLYHASVNYSESCNIGLTFGVTFLGVKVTAGVESCPYSGSVNRDSVQLVDINADGLPDLVSSDRESHMTVRYNKGGKTNLLKSATNLAGAGFLLDYTLSAPLYEQPSRSWNLTSVETYDSLNPNGGQRTITQFEYANPHYDRYERTSYGYGSVVTRQIDPRTMETYRYVARNYNNRSLLQRGKMTCERTYGISDGQDKLYIERMMEATMIDYLHGDTLSDEDCPKIAYPSTDSTFTRFYEGSDSVLLETGEKYEYDRYHNVIKYIDYGDFSDPADGLVVEFSYLTGQPYNLIGLRSEYKVIPTGSTDVARRATFEYNDHGKLTKQTLHNGTEESVYDFSYDVDYGNMDTAFLPENFHGERMYYAYTYDYLLHTYPIRIDDAYGEHSTATYDLRHGKPLSVTDHAGGTMTYTYDFAGRLTSVNSPQNTSGTPSVVNHYYVANYFHNTLASQGTGDEMIHSRPYAVTEHFGDDGDTITRTVVITDGSGRVVQTKKGLTVDGTRRMQVSGRTIIDPFGRTITQYDPFTSPCTDTLLGHFFDNLSPDSTHSDYDILDRVTSTVQPYGITTRTEYTIKNDTTGHRRFYSKVTDPEGNVTHQYTDYDGHQVQVTDANGGITLMQYDNLGQLMTSTDPEGFTTSYGYDNLGHLVSREHPDAGITNYLYDPAGNLTKEVNPLGEINYDYTYYRPTEKRYGYMTGNDVIYTYGTDGEKTGRLISVVDGSGSVGYNYDALGNIIDETRTIAVPNSDNVYQFQMNYSYDSWGRMLQMTYPDGEKVNYTYQWGGDLRSMNGNNVYIDSIRYNPFGQRSAIHYGNGTHVEYTYDDLHRLVNLTSYTSDGTPMQQINYTFDNVSNVTDIVNSAGVVNTLGGGYKNIYKYDALHRLESSNGGGAIGNYDTYLRYSPSGRLIEKYRNNHSVTTSATVDMYYGYCNEYQPHAVKRMFDYKNEMLYDMRWDKAGNLGQVSMGKPGEMFERGRFLFWTEDNRMHAAVDEKYFSYYVYDHSGERRLKLTGDNRLLDVNADFMATYTVLNEPTLYPSSYMVLNNKGYTKHYYAGTERVAARLGGGGLNALQHVIAIDDDLQWKADKLFKQSLEQVNYRVLDENDLDCIMHNEYARAEFGKWIEGIPYHVRADVQTEYWQFKEMVNSMLDDPNNGHEKEVYFYHSDHLGSASWITDADGKPIQHLQYLPYGEPYVNQRISGYNERFTFTGKERDEETGYGYFGARYMDHELTTMWLSVDPMADKYPSISPYAYCAWNPVKLVDPDGQDWYDLYDDGTLVRNEEKSKEYQNSDVIWSVSNKTLSDKFSLGTLSEQRRDEKNGETGSYINLTGSRKENVSVFKFCSDNSNVEFSLMEIALFGDETFTRLTTSHNERRVGVPSTDNYGSEYAKSEFFNLISHLHNHAGQASPSGDDESGDISFRNKINGLRQVSGQATPVLWGIYKCKGNEKYTKDYDGNIIDPVTMRPF